MMETARLDKFSQFIEDRRQSVCRQIVQSFHLSEQDAEDIFQNAVIALYKSIEANMPESLDNFFHGIWFRQTLKFMRDNKPMEHLETSERPLEEEHLSGVSLGKVHEILQSKSAGSITPQLTESPEDLFDIAQMKEQVKKALDMMAGKCKHLLTQYYLVGYSWAEIAVQLDMKNADTAKAAANRCRRRFEEKYKELEIYVK